MQFYSIINIYGCVDNTPTRNQKYRWSLEKYHILPDQEEILNSRLLKFKQQMDFFNKLYFSSELATKKIYKNILNCDNYVNIPRMLYIEAEFDYFRWSNRYLINEKLQETCVDIIMFKGFCNETLICINKISQYINHI